ncbi:hypothetical protein [Streptomyces mirabilis]
MPVAALPGDSELLGRPFGLPAEQVFAAMGRIERVHPFAKGVGLAAAF